MTAMDPLDKEMGPTPEFREHFRKLLSEMRHREVSLLNCCVLRWHGRIGCVGVCSALSNHHVMC